MDQVRHRRVPVLRPWVPDKVIQERLGHSSNRLPHRHQHAIGDDEQAAADFKAAVLAPEQTERS